MDLLNYIENGGWSFPDLDIEQSSEDCITKTMGDEKCDESILCDVSDNQHSISNETDCQVEFSSPALNRSTISEAIPTQTDFVHQYAASTQTDNDNQRPISTQTDFVHQCTASSQTDFDNQRAASNLTLYQEEPVTSTV